MKKEYITPRALTVELHMQALLAVLSPTSTNPSTKPSDDPYDGKFSAPGYSNWDDEEE